MEGNDYLRRLDTEEQQEHAFYCCLQASRRIVSWLWDRLHVQYVSWLVDRLRVHCSHVASWLVDRLRERALHFLL